MITVEGDLPGGLHHHQRHRRRHFLQKCRTYTRLQFKIQVVVIGAAWVKSRLAPGAEVSAAEILSDRQGAVTTAAEDGVGVAFVLAPRNRRVASQVLMAQNARVKLIATLKSNSDQIAIRVVVCALSALINARTEHRHITNRR